MKPLRHHLLRSNGARQSLVLGAAMITSGALDYAVNVVAGRRLDPLDFGVFVSVMAVLQVLTLAAIAIRMVVAFYTASMSVGPSAPARVARFLRQVEAWAWRYGAISTTLMALAAPPLARWLRLPGPSSLWAASSMVLLLYVREAAFGGLQGVESFLALSVVQVVQAALRLAACAVLIGIGWGAVGAILAQPLAAAVCVALSAAALRPHLGRRGDPGDPGVSWHYSFSTLLALMAFGMLTNVDALFVRRFFDVRTAADYAPVVTLAKVALFLSWAIGLVLFPKVARRTAAGEDTRVLLVAGLAAALSPGLALSALYLAFPGALVKVMFTGAYADPGVVLGLASLAATLYAGLHIWLNYALSTERKSYAYVLAGVLVWQVAGMWLLGRGDLVRMTLVMVSGGVIGNVAGVITTWPRARVAGTSALQLARR